MDLFQLITLALIQGLTEFLPISSSAHLILPAQILHWPDQGLAFDIAVHFGSLLAVVAYFRADLMALAGGGVNAILRRQIDPQVHFIVQLAIATVPIAIVGALAKDFIEANLRTTAIIAYATIGFGIALGVADRRAKEASSAATIGPGYLAAGVIGLAQILALIPGTSRSGITITAALFLGLSRPDAARFSFLLAIPTIAGAAILGANDAVATNAVLDWGTMALGAGVAGVAAYLCIGTFIRLVNRTGMLPYVIYRLLLGCLLLVLL